MEEKKLLISLNDPEILNPEVSPLFTFEKEITGFQPVDFWQSMRFGRTETEKAFLEDKKMGQAAHNFQLFCQSVEKKPAEISKVPENPTIPPLIHFIWLGSPIPKEFHSVMKTWRRCHPGWEIKIWDEKGVENFPWSNGYIKWLYGDAKTWGEKSDILRYEILFQFGGIYSDLDMICLKSFNDLISHKIEFFGGQETNTSEDSAGKIVYLSNALIGSAKNHPVIKFCLDHLISQDESPKATVMERTGPFLLSRACAEFLSDEKVLLLPCSYLYPLPHFRDLSHKTLTAKEIKNQFIPPESLTLHLWAASWYL